MKNIIIYTDGACSGNPGPGGWAFILYVEDDGISKTGIAKSGGEINTTNQRMELTACIKGMTQAALHYLNKSPICLKVHTDSAYLANCIKDKWYEKWRKNGWKNSKGEIVKNLDLWEDILSFVDNPLIKIEMIKVTGHGSDVLNNKVDELAKYEVMKVKNNGLR